MTSKLITLEESLKDKVNLIDQLNEKLSFLKI